VCALRNICCQKHLADAERATKDYQRVYTRSKASIFSFLFSFSFFVRLSSLSAFRASSLS
jgi:hypothetical protein